MDPFDVNIYAEDVANSQLQDPPNVSSRVKTTDFVNWKDAPKWTVEHAAGPDQQTPNVASLVQDIVNKDAWVEGNTLGFILTGQGTRTAESFEGAGTHADQIPQLHVIYQKADTTNPGNGGGNNGGGTTPPGNGGGTTPPGNGGGTTPPGNGDGTTPPGNGGGTTPPDNGNGGGTPVIPANPFKDVDSHYDWAKDAISVLADKGIINGTSALTFEPGKQITELTLWKCSSACWT